MAVSEAARGEAASFIEPFVARELLRFTTAGSVDDGKSTLIGRLLHDCRAVYEDQLASVQKSRINRSGGPIDFALLTDGLRAEREQGITIDVAYRYFETPRRKFIIADTPGHEQYTRNMATGASTADLAVILIDATRGVLTQTRRHAHIAALLGIRHVVAAVNKMDLAGYEEAVFARVEAEFAELAAQLGIGAVSVPVSALAGANVVERSERMPWYRGPTLLEHLETVPLTRGSDVGAARFPVQYVIRPDATFRGFAGQVAAGVIRPGDAVLALPSRRRTRVRSIVTFDGEAREAAPPMSVTLTLEDEIDLSRGEMLVSPDEPPHVSRRFAATVVWFDGEPLALGRNYLLKHTTRTTRARVSRIRHRANMNTSALEPAERLAMNDIGVVEVETAAPLFFDPYERNRTTGSFILIDLISNATVGAGMIREELPEPAVVTRGGGREAARPRRVTREDRYRRHGHYPAFILAEGRPELAARLEAALFAQGFEVVLVNSEDAPTASREGLLHMAQTLGAVVVYATPAREPAAREGIAALAPERFLDLSEADLPASDEEAVEKVLAWAESLRADEFDE